MRFSTTFLTATLTVAILAAPIADRAELAEEDDCEPDYPESASTALGQLTATRFTSTPQATGSASARVSYTKKSMSAKSKTTKIRSTTVATTAVIPTSSSVGIVVSITSSTSAQTTAVIPTSSGAATTFAISTSSAVETSAAQTSVAQTSAIEETSTSITEAASSTSVAEVASSTSLAAAASSSVVVVISTATVVPVQATTSTSVLATSSATSSAATSTSTGKLEFIGANESGAEFGQANLPGVLGTDYTWPNTTAIQTLMDKGMNIFRIPILMERIAQGTMTATLDATYLAALTTVVDYITAAGAHAVIDPHNYGRYDGTIFTSTSDFQTFWTNVATEFKSNDLVIFDCNNEFHDEPSNTVVADLNQACIDGVRAAGATTQYIFVEGTSYTGAWTWVSSGNGDAMVGLTDTYDKIVYEMHQYLDSDGSGTSSTCVSSTIGAERVAAATAWLQANGKKGIIGEYAGGVNTQCETAVTGMLDALSAASDVWLGAMWWGAGPWWGTYLYSLEPPSGTAYSSYIDLITAYV